MDTFCALTGLLIAIIGIVFSYHTHRRGLKDTAARDEAKAATELRARLDSIHLHRLAQKIARDVKGAKTDGRPEELWTNDANAIDALQSLSFKFKASLLDKGPSNHKDSLWNTAFLTGKIGARALLNYADYVNEALRLSKLTKVQLLREHGLDSHDAIRLYQAIYALLTNGTIQKLNDERRKKYIDLNGRQWPTKV